MQNKINILFVGDIVGEAGRKIFYKKIMNLKQVYEVDFTIVNVENAAGGKGITPQIADEILSYGVDVMTSGNHIWDKKEIEEYLKNQNKLLRPLNYPPGVPGVGSIILNKNGINIAVINLLGRVFMDSYDCPFRCFDSEYENLKKITNIIIVDFHAEATSEKMAFGWYVDGRASAVIGTHTHIQTADERILPSGTAYITDVGMTGPMDSVIGIKKEIAIKRFLTQMPIKFKISKLNPVMCCVLIEIDTFSGKALSIKRLQIKEG